MKAEYKVILKWIADTLLYIPLFFEKLIINNNGYSSKSFIMLWGALMITIWSFNIFELIRLSVIKGYEVNWYGIAAVITALSTLAGVVIWGKIKNEVNEFHGNLPPPNNDTEP